jgi:hypothetical protein
MKNRIVVLFAAIIAVIIPTTIGSLNSQPVSACETNAQGCINNNGPGASVFSPPEVSGCHVFPPVSDCARDSTPVHLGPPP